MPNAENRGYGIITSKKMITDGLDGLFVMLSGDAMLTKTRKNNEYFKLPEDISYNGTLIVMRIPYVNSEFNYIDYVE